MSTNTSTSFWLSIQQMLNGVRSRTCPDCTCACGEQTEKRLTAFVHEMLSPLQKSGQISSEGRAWVAEKTVHKVLERRQTSQQQPDGAKQHDLLSAGRREKIKALVQK